MSNANNWPPGFLGALLAGLLTALGAVVVVLVALGVWNFY